MEKKFISIKNIRLCYYERNEAALQTIFFIHGNSCSAQTWRAQLTNSSLKPFRLIAFDLPAHGASSEDPDQNYSVVGLAEILAKAVILLSNGCPFLLAGFSLGANIAAEMLAFKLQPTGIILISPCIIGDEYGLQSIGLPGFDPSVAFSDTAYEKAVETYFSSTVYYSSKQVVDELIYDYKLVKPPFRSTLISKTMSGEVSNELQLLRESGLPALVVFGKQEQLINADYLDNAQFTTWQNQIFKLEEAGHFVHIDQPALINKLISAFATERFEAVPATVQPVEAGA